MWLCLEACWIIVCVQVFNDAYEYCLVYVDWINWFLSKSSTANALAENFSDLMFVFQKNHDCNIIYKWSNIESHGTMVE